MTKLELIKEGIRNPRGAYVVIRKKLENDTSKVLFKNTAGLTNNLKGRIVLSRTKKLDKNFKNKISNSNAEQFIKNGYLNMGHPYDQELIRKISEKMDKLILDDKYSWIRAKHNGKVYSRALYRAHELIPETAELLDDEMIEIIEQYYASHFRVTKVVYWRNYHIPPEIAKKQELMSSNWHCDASNISWLKLFINLTDVTEKDGPLHVQSGERTKELMKLGYRSRNNYNLPLDVIENEKYIWKATGDAGAALMCNCNLGLHRAGIPDPGHYRDSFQFQFAPSNEPLPKDWIKTFVDPNEPIRPGSTHNEPIDPYAY